MNTVVLQLSSYSFGLHPRKFSPSSGDLSLLGISSCFHSFFSLIFSSIFGQSAFPREVFSSIRCGFDRETILPAFGGSLRSRCTPLSRALSGSAFRSIWLVVETPLSPRSVRCTLDADCRLGIAERNGVRVLTRLVGHSQAQASLIHTRLRECVVARLRDLGASALDFLYIPHRISSSVDLLFCRLSTYTAQFTLDSAGVKW